MKYLLDTNICVHLLRGRSDVAHKIDAHGLQNCCISEITKAELLFGQRLAQRRGVNSNPAVLNKFFDSIDIVPISDCLELYAEEKDRLFACGQPLEDFDLLIACSAVRGGYVLVSENAAHMLRIKDIRVENWVERP